jgi:hypothetical protein
MWPLTPDRCKYSAYMTHSYNQCNVILTWIHVMVNMERCVYVSQVVYEFVSDSYSLSMTFDCLNMSHYYYNNRT